MRFLIITIITILNVQAQYEHDVSKTLYALIAPNEDIDVIRVSFYDDKINCR